MKWATSCFLILVLNLTHSTLPVCPRQWDLGIVSRGFSGGEQRNRSSSLTWSVAMIISRNKRQFFRCRENSSTGLSWYTKMAAVSLFCTPICPLWRHVKTTIKYFKLSRQKFSIFTKTIMHLVHLPPTQPQPHPPLPPPQKKQIHDHCFQFLLGITVISRDIEDNAYANVWGINKVHYRICENDEW